MHQSATAATAAPVAPATSAPMGGRSSAAGRGRAPAQWLDGTLAALLAAVTFVLLLPYLDPAFLSVRRSVHHQPDEGTILSNADRMARGHAIYRDVFDFKGPVGYAPFVAAFKLAAPTARNGRLAMFVVIALWTAAMYGAARIISGRRSLGAVVALLIPLQVWPAWSYAYQDFTAQFFLTLGLLLALIGSRASRASSSRAWLGLVGGGFCASMVFWTSVAQGLSGMVGLWGAVTVVGALSGGAPAALRTGGRFGLGVLLGCALVLGWLASLGVAGPALYWTIPFPMAYYMSPANVAPYAYDESIYSSQWLGDGPRWVHLAVKSIMRVTALVPRMALPWALAVAAVLAAALILRWRARSWSSDEGSHASAARSGFLARLALPSALAAPAVPVIMERTRSDICHIGFIEGGCLLALCGVFAVRPVTAFWRRVASTVQLAVAAGLVYTLVVAGAFHAYAWRRLPPGVRDIDELGRQNSGAEAVMAQTRPTDRIFATPYGGWTYLYTRRDNATPFAFLIDDSYCTLHWPIAARQIVAHRPVLLLIPERHFQIVVGHEPQIASMYTGSPGNYTLRR